MMGRTLEQVTMRKLYRRLLSFAILAYFLCYPLNFFGIVSASLGMLLSLSILRRERFQRFGDGFNAEVCTFNVRNLLALDI